MSDKLILGINSAGFNTSSVLLKNGKVLFAVEEERIIRDKRTRKFPNKGIAYGLKKFGYTILDIDAIAVGWNPAVNLEAYNSHHAYNARYLGEIFYNVPLNILQLQASNAGIVSSQKITLENGKEIILYFINHHICHASNFFVSPFDGAAIMTVDAFGEKQTTTFAIGEDSTVNQIWSQEFPHSLGGFYSTMTEYLGFRAQSDEWKLMGASSYGDGKRFYKILRSLVNLTDGNGFELDLRYFNFYQFHRPNRYTKKMEQLIGLPPNKVDEPLNQDYYDLAAASQDIFEDIYIHLINQLHKQTKRNNLVLSGGSALNSVTNGKVLNLTQFENVFIPPSPDDSGTSLGAAYYVYHNIFGHRKSFVMSSNYWGPSYTNSEIKVELNKYKIQYRLSDSVELEAAELISQGKIIGWFQGALEFGDRALGNRSILADPRDSSMKDKVNETVKYREPFRPFAPSVLIEKADEYFENFVETPYMEKVFPIIVHKRSEIPAVTHIDGSGRLQTVRKKDNPKYYALIKNFFKITGVPVVLNTSFNLKGEAIVCSPADAIRTFYSSGLDALVIGDYLIVK